MKINGILLLCVTILFPTLLLPTDRYATPQAKPGGRALIVGVEHYRGPHVPNTPGCENDARSMAKFVHDKYGFDTDSIKVLLNEQATAENIKRTFAEWLIKGTKSGERVFFSYAGHGSQLSELHPGSKANHMDQTIAPYDTVLATGDNEIRDDEFAALIKQLSGRMSVLLFDSCHSGTISRSLPSPGKKGRIPGGGSRYLPSPEQYRAIFGSGDVSRGLDDGYAVQTSKSRDLIPPFIDTKKVGGIAGAVVISASKNDQLAHPINVNGEYHGVLTYLFEEIQRKSGIPTFQSLKEELASRMADLVRRGKIDDPQEPQYDVISTVPLDNQPLFGGYEVIPLVAMANPLSPINLDIRTLERRSIYHIGETVSYEATTDTPGYLYIIVFSRENVATCIFPYRDDRGNPEDNHIDSTMRLPLGPGGYPIQEPIGRDVVVALLSPTRLNIGERKNGAYTWDEVFERLNQKQLQDAIGSAASRGQGVRPISGQGLQGANWQAKTLILETQP